MKIVIAGAGEVGFHLAKLLSYESQEITLIDMDKERLAYANDHLDIRVLRGDVVSLAVLREARVNLADLFIGVTSSQTTNITASVIAKRFGAKRTIARISNTEFIDHRIEIGFNQFGIDELISPESLAAAEIELLLNQYGFNESYEFEDGALTMLSLKLSKKSSLLGKSVKEAAKVFPELHFMPIAIQRLENQDTIIPRGNTEFIEGDTVVFITSKGGDEELFKLSGKVKTEIKNVMILGGSKIGFKTTKDLCKSKFNVKLIENDRDTAMDLAEELPNALVINGDGRNVELLEEENIGDMDAFIAVTGNAETNIMSCLVAKSRGVKKTIALVENMDYYQLSHTIGIDTLINKKLLAASSIFRYIRKGDVVAITKLGNINAELLEFVVNSNSKITRKNIKDLDFPRSAIIGGVIREGEGLIPLGDFHIHEGDRVVVCCLPSAIPDVEKLFN